MLKKKTDKENPVQSPFKKVGNIDFNIATVSKMSYDAFRKKYKGRLKGANLAEAFELVTGNKPPIK